MGILVFRPGEALRFEYRNHRGVTEWRNVIFKALDWGDNEWYPERQWFMRCYDRDREADRSFALARIDADAILRVPNGLLDAVEKLAGEGYWVCGSSETAYSLTARSSRGSQAGYEEVVSEVLKRARELAKGGLLRISDLEAIKADLK